MKLSEYSDRRFIAELVEKETLERLRSLGYAYYDGQAWCYYFFIPFEIYKLVLTYYPSNKAKAKSLLAKPTSFEPTNYAVIRWLEGRLTDLNSQAEQFCEHLKQAYHIKEPVYLIGYRIKNDKLVVGRYANRKLEIYCPKSYI